MLFYESFLSTWEYISNINKVVRMIHKHMLEHHFMWTLKKLTPVPKNHGHLSFSLMVGDVHNLTSRLDLIYLSTCKSHTPHFNATLCLSTCWRSKHGVSVCFYEIYMKKKRWAFVTHDTQRRPVSRQKIREECVCVCVCLCVCVTIIFCDVLIVSSGNRTIKGLSEAGRAARALPDRKAAGVDVFY